MENSFGGKSVVQYYIVQYQTIDINQERLESSTMRWEEEFCLPREEEGICFP